MEKAEKRMKRYIYRGPVERYGVVISYDWQAETSAASLSKARNNLAYRYKKEHNIAKEVPIKLPGHFEVREYV